jgi:hypothetical protein
MYEIDIMIQGIASILQHRFAPEQLNTLMQGANKKTGVVDYSKEWMKTMYVTSNGYLYQPANHIEGSLVEAAKRFTIKGSRGKTWREAIQAYCYVKPEKVIHLRNGEEVKAPAEELLINPTEFLAVNTQRVKVQRAAVARSRLEIAAGWQLAFTLEIVDEQARPDVIEAILREAGRAVGIGDFRPRYGRFELVTFEVRN